MYLREDMCIFPIEDSSKSPFPRCSAEKDEASDGDSNTALRFPTTPQSCAQIIRTIGLREAV